MIKSCNKYDYYMIVKKEKKRNVIIYYVKADCTDEEMSKILNNKLKRTQIEIIIDHDADVFTENWKWLLRFRKNKLNKKYIEHFYDKLNTHNQLIMTNIMGYIDTLSPAHKVKFKMQWKKQYGEYGNIKVKWNGMTEFVLKKVHSFMPSQKSVIKTKKNNNVSRNNKTKQHK